ncbi:hypothetical protein [Sphingomonas immobilis]|uniref:Uncharacterized protein n=1 Tax=Sphingomonas immobilis TaxID=3063997 RepID=A0ABT8ZXG4_9SPHN|nr:hypothetical protein [Sphingomonas sp. CA1-15]MDO7841983.1 hypothetical protein [Sphingomonas sp. CA1-15]
MLKFTLFAAAAAISLASVPALATEPAATAVSGEGAKIADVAPAAPKAETKYCVIDTIIGSRIPHKECHTRKEWIEKTGIDPLTDK